MRQPTPTMIEALTPIWERVLQHSPIGVEDNFFDLGGDSSAALELFNEIARLCGRELPPVMIYHASTIAALATILEQPTAPRVPPLVLLKAGSEEPPVFFAHGLGGNAMDFFQVVKHIQSGHPIYGIQAKGIDGVDEAFDRIEDMAQFYLDAIKDVQPKGPYFLVGYSLGGLVMLEMAQCLSENGEKVALLAMLDSYPHSRHLSIGQRVHLAARLAKHHASTIAQLPMGKSFAYIVHSSERDLYSSQARNGSARNRSPIGVTLAPIMQRMSDRAYLALRRYRPRLYKGKIKFVRAEIVSLFPPDPAAVWANLVDKIEIETVAGDHLGIITDHFESLAAVLSRFLKEAVC